MKKKITLLLIGLSPLFLTYAQLPTLVAGNMKIANGANLVAKGDVITDAGTTTNGVIVNNGTMKIKGLTVESNPFRDGMLLNYGSVMLDGSTVASDLKILKTVRGNNWNYMSFPFDVKISEITTGTGAPLVIGDINNPSANLYIMKFDPALAATSTAGNNVNGLVSILDPNTVLKAGLGYVIAVNDDVTTTIIFKANTSDGFGLARTFTPANTVNLVNEMKPGVTSLAQWGWNYVGASQLCAYRLNSANMGGYRGAVYVHRASGGYEAKNVQYESLVIPNFVGYYTQVFEQINMFTINHSASGMTNDNSSDNLRSESNPEVTILKLALLGNGSEDHCTFIIGDEFNEAIQVGEDFPKLFASKTVSQIWSDKNTVINLLPASTTKEIPLGVILGKNVQHSIELLNEYNGNDFTAITLIDKEKNVEHDLLKGGYTFTAAPEAKIEGRFALQFNKAATALPTIDAQGVVVYAQDNNVHVQNILSGDRVSVYDFVGRLIAQTTSNATSVSLPLNAKGAFIVKVSGQTTHTSKIVNQ